MVPKGLFDVCMLHLGVGGRINSVIPAGGLAWPGSAVQSSWKQIPFYTAPSGTPISFNRMPDPRRHFRLGLATPQRHATTADGSATTAAAVIFQTITRFNFQLAGAVHPVLLWPSLWRADEMRSQILLSDWLKSRSGRRASCYWAHTVLVSRGNACSKRLFELDQPNRGLTRSSWMWDAT